MQILIRSLLPWLALWLSTSTRSFPFDDGPVEPPAPREQIGEVLGKPVYRDEIRKGQSRTDELNRLFLAPVFAKYRREHEAEITPTPEEVAAAQEVFDRQHAERLNEEGPGLHAELLRVATRLQRKDLPDGDREDLESQKRTLELELRPPGKPFATFVLTNWKFQRHLYEKFGGGRLLTQQRGLEAVDAMRAFIEIQQKGGAIKITAPDLRDRFDAEWTTLDSGPWLVKDADRIRAEFLEPAWARKATK